MLPKNHLKNFVFGKKLREPKIFAKTWAKHESKNFSEKENILRKFLRKQNFPQKRKLFEKTI
jgi:hypothetical protein